MKALIAGAGGQLGRALRALTPDTVGVAAAGREQLDLTDPASIERTLDDVCPDVVLNAAAYTAVDAAERETELAYAVNAEGVAALGRACVQRGVRLLHVSTDFVFDGSSSVPYAVDADTNPINVYGASKLAGERLLAQVSGLDWTLVRTAWVYAADGRNFLNTMLKLMGERDAVSVVADQVGTPTSAASLAGALWAIVLRDDIQGVHHWTDAGVASWYDFAVAIQEEALAMNLLDRQVPVIPITSSEFSTAARRPAYSVLDKSSSWKALNGPALHWRASLRNTLREKKDV